MSQRSNTTAIPISPQAPASQRKRDASGTKHIYIEHIMFFPRYPDQQKRSIAISKFRDAWLRHIANEILGVCTHYSGYAQLFMNIRDRRSRNWRHEVCFQRANIYLAKHTLVCLLFYLSRPILSFSLSLHPPLDSTPLLFGMKSRKCSITFYYWSHVSRYSLILTTINWVT